MSKSKRFYQYDTLGGKLWAYRRVYKSRLLRLKGFSCGRFEGDGFNLHSLRLTYITHLLSNGVDAPTVMEYSGHKSYQSFSVYLHKTNIGEKGACLILESVDGKLTASEIKQHVKNGQNASAGAAQPLQNHKSADRMRSVAS